LEFVHAAEQVGLRGWRIILTHILPNVTSSAIVLASFGAVVAILSESALSYLGIGVGTGTPTWGGILSDGREYLRTGWWVMTFPGLTLVATVMSLSLIGDWLRDRLDPRLRAFHE
jgi:peptide/nickel transport system permease protein